MTSVPGVVRILMGLLLVQMWTTLNTRLGSLWHLAAGALVEISTETVHSKRIVFGGRYSESNRDALAKERIPARQAKD